MKVIGLTGFAKSGKSTAAEILKSMGGQEVAFAKHLKDVCSVVLSIPRSHFDDQAYKEVKFSQSVNLYQWEIEQILKYFEVPVRLHPASVLKHQGTGLTSPRHVAQYIGTELLREIDTDIHIKMAFKLNEGSGAEFLICSDVRFANEMKAVRNGSGMVLGISRKAATPENIENLHPSEREIPSLIEGSTFVIRNESTIQEFQESVKKHALMFLK